MGEEKTEELLKESFWLSNENKYNGINDIFYKNGEKITKKELKDSVYQENDISRVEFKEIIKGEVSSFIEQSFDNIVILLGAGASVVNNEFKKDDNGINISGVTVAKIACEVKNRLETKNYHFVNPDKQAKVYTLEEITQKVKYEYGIEDKKFNLEDVISLIISYEELFGEPKFSDTKNAIFDVIKKATSYDYNDDLFKHLRLLKSLSSLVKEEHKLNIITTNYDTLIEDAATRIDYTVIDGFSFSQKPKFNSNMFDWNVIKDVPNIKTKQNIYMKNVVNLLKIHGSLTWEKSQSGKSIVRKDKRNVENPIMVFPSSNKYAQSYEEPYFDLFAKFQELLKQPNTLFITTGFSFSDNHISKMIISAIKGNEGLATLITDYDIDSKNENWQELVSMMDNLFRIAFLKSSLNSDLTDYLGGLPDDN